MAGPAKRGQYCFGKNDYESKFDPQVFLRDYANPENHAGSLSPVFQLDLKWIETFASGAVQGQRLLDFGCGPSLHNAIPASRRFQEIYMCEYVQQNRQVIQDWIDKKPHAYDWTPFFKFVAEKEGEGATFQEIEERMREKIQNIIPCDIHKANPFEPAVFDPGFFDCITDNFCLGAGCKTEEEFKAAVQKLSSYIRPGGRMLMIGSIGQTYYRVGCERFFNLYKTKTLVETALREANFRDVRLEKVNLDLIDSISDAKWVYFVEGTKQ